MFMRRLWLLLGLPLVTLGSLSSSNYVLQSYDIGNGAGNGTSTNYTVNGEAGSAGGTFTSTSYTLPAGVQASATVPVPGAPTFTNASNNYDRLHLTLNVGSAPGDMTYLIAISSDGFTTTNYVQLDDTVGSAHAASNFQSYAAWGGASGFSVLGLTPGTTYSVKVAAMQGKATASGFGPTASAATVQPSMTFGLSTSLTSTPPFTSTFTSLPAGSVVTGNATVTAALTTNAVSGGSIMIASQFGGLKSTAASFTLPSATADLSVAAQGYGAQVTSASQSSGGPLAAVSPYNGASNAVGVLGTSLLPLASFSSPLTSGSLTFKLLAKTDITVPSAADYADTLTVIAAPLF